MPVRVRVVGVAPLVKALLVAVLCRIRCRRRQVWVARTVRSVWPGFTHV